MSNSVMDEMEGEKIDLMAIENEGESYLEQICRADHEEKKGQQKDNDSGPPVKIPKIVIDLECCPEEEEQYQMESCASTVDSPENTESANPAQNNKELETSVEHVDFNNNADQVDFNHIEIRSSSSPKTVTNDDLNLEPHNNTHFDKESAINHKSGAIVETFNDQSNEAEEIIRKLCKSGRIEQVQDHGENCIKLIVCEDSQGSNEADDTLSAEELEQAERRDHQVQQQHKNLLQCLTENVAVTRFDVENSAPQQVYPVDIQFSNTAIQMPQPAHQQFPSVSFSLASPVEYVPTSNLLGHYDNEVVPIHFQPDQQSTPHPRSGYMFYRPNDIEEPKQPASDSTPVYRAHPENVGQNVSGGSQIHLNSSGEENRSPPEVKQTSASGRGKTPQQRIRSLIEPPTFFDGEDWGKIREQHNQKERRRRARIKEACGLLRQLVPGMSDKTDKATVFEFAARYVHFLKSHTGSQFDKDFLMKYSPY